MSLPPILYRRTGGTLTPLPRFGNEFASQFEDGKLYRLAEVEERSLRSHNHFFASVAEAWKNLPEEYAQEFPTPEHLRKWVLIKTGWYDQESIVLDTKGDALVVAGYARRDVFAVVTVEDRTVTVYRAKSQSKRNMGAANFQRSKQDVLDFLDDLLNVERGQTAAHAGEAA